jgi:hypothetical protein
VPTNGNHSPNIIFTDGEIKMETPQREAKTLIIDINLTRGLTALLIFTLLVGALLGYLLLAHESAAASTRLASGTLSTGMRRFYLTKTKYDGSLAAGATVCAEGYHFATKYDGSQAASVSVCAEGYHFASLWEILGVSNLEYAQSLGETQDDSAEGPPASIFGWVRTGFSDDTSATAGKANCSAWSTTSGNGTTAALPQDWTDPSNQEIHVWDVEYYGCSMTWHVWCVED